MNQARAISSSRHNNINALRFIAASMVIYSHMNAILGFAEPAIMGYSMGAIAVYIFFILSGFLIANSWKRDPCLLRYLIRRIMRIFPGLLVVVTLTVFVLGPILTDVPIDSYFADIRTWEYLKNCLLQTVLSLPGVFEENPFPSVVNGSLWTLPWEFLAYLLLPILLLLVRKLGRCALILVYAIASCGYILSYIVVMPIPHCVADCLHLAFFFISGVVVSEFQILQKINVQWGFAALLFALIFHTENGIVWIAANALIIVVCTITFALSEKPIFGSLFSKNDFSYGIYIYAFPIQQTLVMVLGADEFGGSVPCYTFLAWVITLLFAIVSWFVVEKPMIAFGRKLTQLHREKRSGTQLN